MKQHLSSIKWLAFPLFLLLLLINVPQSEAQIKSYYWERFDVDMVVLENGDMHVTETQTLNFSGQPFTFGFGTIYTGDKGNNDGITDISVSENSVQYRESSSEAPGAFEVDREGDDVNITWYFEPAVGERTYTFSYTVRGPIRVGTSEQGDGDQLYWKAIPADHGARIENSTIRVTLPEGVQPQKFTGSDDYLVAAYLNQRETDEVDIRVSDDGRTITYNAEDIPAGEMLEVRIQFPHGILDIPTPGWQRREQLADTAGLVVGAVAVLILIGGPLFVLGLWYVRGRDPEIGVAVPEYISEPPDDLPPAVVGTLVDEKADMHDIISTLVDLARRGYLTMSEEDREYTFYRTDKSDADLRPFEQRFLKDIFRGKEERSLKSLRYKFHNKLPRLRKMLYEELVKEELVPRSPQDVRNSYGCIGGSMIVLAGLGFFVLPAVFGSLIDTAVCPSFSLGVTAVVMLIVSRVMPNKSRKGAIAAAKWNAFKNYLRRIEEYENLEEAGEIFDKYLPYATVFGLERSWIRKFAKVPGTPVPPWYYPYGYGRHHGPIYTGTGGAGSGGGMSAPTLEGMSGGLTGGLQGMSDGLTRMLTNTNTILKSTPPSSSSGSSGGFSGGFSGGGFSSGGGGSRGFG